MYDDNLEEPVDSLIATCVEAGFSGSGQLTVNGMAFAGTATVTVGTLSNYSAAAALVVAASDQLSATGEAQARRLGEYWVKCRLAFDAVFVGPRRRHERKAAFVGDSYAGAGLPSSLSRGTLLARARLTAWAGFGSMEEGWKASSRRTQV